MLLECLVDLVEEVTVEVLARLSDGQDNRAGLQGQLLGEAPQLASDVLHGARVMHGSHQIVVILGVAYIVALLTASR
ncbi:hypothetical protein AB0C81_18685 [Streptomyces roseoverticillatus]|uniref:hypothetical protein n=1 Tax=Streptomyces roseoverticillatus TaxID=66429 RepID=UPI0033F5F65A